MRVAENRDGSRADGTPSGTAWAGAMSNNPTYVAQRERAHDGILIAGVPEGISARRFAPERGRGKYFAGN